MLSDNNTVMKDAVLILFYPEIKMSGMLKGSALVLFIWVKPFKFIT